ncbi:MotA/TolQ/ExbB proton channel family protein [Emcibacter sp.]|uniref:MotA/TolQ/ExbB proton channel family protein n=1 Tax=Emcibacter sp. TaxID=1979954 RepID=UPI002AA6FEB7|nr:MotA/TolQ/ExbB proton channel family protein [Emcibacter sp.]
MYQVSDLFMAPVLILLVLLFFYSLYALGGFFVQGYQRSRGKARFRRLLKNGLWSQAAETPKGYPLAALAVENPQVSKDELDVAALGEMEGVRMVSRVAPMLGLIATMIPMGPALKSLSDGDVQGISENLIVAFSAVIFGLVVASITFFIASTKKKWLAQELVALLPHVENCSEGPGQEKEALREAS